MKKLKNSLLVAVLAVFSLTICAANVSAQDVAGMSTSTPNVVTSIYLHSTDVTGVVEWNTVGNSANGYKVMWSKIEGPVYPPRYGDHVDNFANSTANRDVLAAFLGSGTYYVRVCSLIGSLCDVYSNEITITFDGASNMATSTSPTTPTVATSTLIYPELTSIALHAAAIGGGVVEWIANGISAKGFRVIWSKNDSPIFPPRDSDQYHYLSANNANRDVVTAFNGYGMYFVRVCEYTGSACGVFSNEVTVQFYAPVTTATSTKTTVPGSIVCNEIYNPVCGADGITYPNSCFASVHGITSVHAGTCSGSTATPPTSTIIYPNTHVTSTSASLEKIKQNAQQLYQNNIGDLLSQINELRSVIKEQQVQINYLMKLQQGLTPLSASSSDSITNFITYGVDSNTKQLGQGQRAAVIYSFKQAYGTLPTSTAQFEDVIKIANGRWPSATSTAAEAKAQSLFKQIYQRSADMSNAHDAAAIKIMAYGLQQQAQNRNLKSEAAALKTFKAIFNRLPTNTLGWNTLAAITYSGAKK